MEFSSFEKSSFRRTDADTEADLGATIVPRAGVETGPMDGFLRAGDCRNVLIGDLDRGGGSRTLARFSRTCSGSGIVPMKEISKFHSLLQVRKHTLADVHILLA